MNLKRYLGEKTYPFPPLLRFMLGNAIAEEMSRRASQEPLRELQLRPSPQKLHRSIHLTQQELTLQRTRAYKPFGSEKKKHGKEAYTLTEIPRRKKTRQQFTQVFGCGLYLCSCFRMPVATSLNTVQQALWFGLNLCSLWSMKLQTERVFGSHP
eukprot:3342056-Amphidinium_carterae.1